MYKTMKERVRLSSTRAITTIKEQLHKQAVKLSVKYLKVFILLTTKRREHPKMAIFQKSLPDGMSFQIMKPQSKQGYQIMSNSKSWTA
jgi:hypothetical protein